VTVARSEIETKPPGVPASRGRSSEDGRERGAVRAFRHGENSTSQTQRATFAAVAGRLLPSPVRKECFAQAAYYAPARWQLLKKIYGPVTAR